MLLYKSITIFALLCYSSLVYCQDDKKELIASIFTSPEKETCECVKVNQCKGANYGEGLINNRFKETCEEDTQICCEKELIINTDLQPLIGSGKENSSCECVKYYLCEQGFINKDGSNLIDIRIDEDGKFVDNPCGNYMSICCPFEQLKNDTNPTTPAPPAELKRCGYSNPGGVGVKIVEKKTEAEFGEFPWMVVFLKRDSDKNKLLGGGSLIHPKAVLTTAHIINKNAAPQNLRQIVVRAGEWDPQNKNGLYPPQDRKIEKVSIHSDFNSNNLINDVAIVILEEKFELMPHINVICLPNIVKNTAAVSDKCLSGGWGKKSFESKQYQAILKQVELPLVQRRQCQDALRKTRLGRHFLLHRSFICAGGAAGQDTCTGDGGSPLFCPVAGEKDRFEIVGMVAWGIECGKDGIPGVYADVNYLRKWIDEQLSKNDLSLKQFR